MPQSHRFRAFFVLACLVRSASGQWLQDGGSSNHSGVSYESACAAQGFVNAWSFLTSNNVNAGVVVTANGTVFANNNAGNVYSIAPGGALRWLSSAPTGLSTYSAPLLDNRTGLLLSGNNDNKLWAFWSSNGTVAWTYTTGGNIASSPAIAADGTVYVASVSPSSVYALSISASSARLLWINTMSTGATYTSPMVLDGAVYQGCDDNYVYKLNSTGALVWKTAVSTSNVRSDAAAGPNSTVIVADASGRVFALNVSSGAVVWVTALGTAVYSSPAVANGRVYIGCRDNYLYSLGALNGTILWRFLTNANVDGKVAVGADGTVYVGSMLGTMYAVHGTRGTLVGSFDTSGSVIGRPAIGAQGTVYWGSTGDNKIYATRTCCAPGYFCAGGVLASQRICPAGSYCVLASTTNTTLCPRGTFSLAGASSCTTCPAGSFAAAEGSSVCTNCAAGSYSMTPGAEGCSSCPAGKASSAVGATSLSVCTTCIGGSYASAEGSSVCATCPAGHWCATGCTSWAGNNCGRGNYCPAGSSAPTSCGPEGVVDPILGPANGPAFAPDIVTAACRNHCYNGAAGQLSTCV